MIRQYIKNAMSNVKFILLILFQFILFNLISGQTLNELNNAYINRSKEMLDVYFDKWVNRSILKTDVEIDNMTNIEKRVYDIYKTFYNPKDNFKYNELIGGKSIYKDAKYIIVQNSIKAQIIKDFSLDINKLNIEKIEKSKIIIEKENVNFLPNLGHVNSKIIYLNNDFKRQLIDFFQTEENEQKRIALFKTSKDANLNKNKIDFLRLSLRIFPSHWGEYIWIESLPYVEKIIFNKKLDKSIIKYRSYSLLSYALYRLINGKWKLIGSKISAIY